MENCPKVPNLGYIDMGLESNLALAGDIFPNVRRAVMCTLMDLAEEPTEVIRRDLDRIAREHGPCDIVAADIEAGTSDEPVLAFVEMWDKINRTKQAKMTSISIVASDSIMSETTYADACSVYTSGSCVQRYLTTSIVFGAFPKTWCSYWKRTS